MSIVKARSFSSVCCGVSVTATAESFGRLIRSEPRGKPSVANVDRSGQPILDKDGKPTFNQVPVGDIDKFMEIAAALSLTSFRLARFQSPKLQAIAVPQQQAQSSQPIHFKVHIRNAEGEHLMTTIDGEVVDGGEPDMKLIESDRSDGPNDRTDGPDGSDDGA